MNEMRVTLTFHPRRWRRPKVGLWMIDIMCLCPRRFDAYVPAIKRRYPQDVKAKTCCNIPPAPANSWVGIVTEMVLDVTL